MAADSAGRGYDISQWYDSKPVKIGWLALLGIGVFWVLYQRAFGYSHGLDSMTPEFESVWLGLWRFNILANALGGIFYSVAMLPQFWQQVSHLNPILYMVNAFRYGLLGISDINITTAFTVILGFITALYIFALFLLKRGVGVRS